MLTTIAFVYSLTTQLLIKTKHWKLVFMKNSNISFHTVIECFQRCPRSQLHSKPEPNYQAKTVHDTFLISKANTIVTMAIEIPKFYVIRLWPHFTWKRYQILKIEHWKQETSDTMMPFPANSIVEYPLCSEKRANLFGAMLPGCALPVVDTSAQRYSALDRKPTAVQSSRTMPKLGAWETTYGLASR